MWNSRFFICQIFFRFVKPTDIFHQAYMDMHVIDENFPDLSGIPDFSFARFFVSGYGHHYISGSINICTNIFRIFFVRPFSAMHVQIYIPDVVSLTDHL